MKIQPLLDKFVDWIRAQPDVEAVALVGSYARGDPTEESDVDLITLTTQVSKYIGPIPSSDPAGNWPWVEQFGKAMKCEIESWGRVKSLRVGYQDGVEVEYSFASPAWAGIPVDPGTRHVVSNGMKILFDSGGALAKLQQEVFATSRPGERQFRTKAPRR